jgi:hypothetical protein
MLSLFSSAIPLQVAGILLLGGGRMEAEAPAAPGPLLALDLSALRAFQAPAASGRLGAQARPPASAPEALPAPAAFSEARAGRVGVRGGLGFTLDPDTFLMGFEGDYSIFKELAVGPLLQLGVSDHRLIVAPTLNAQWMFDLPFTGLERLKPFLQGGLGFAYLARDRPGPDADDVGFLLNMGFGTEFYLGDRFSLGSNMLFNVLPDRVLGEHFFFSWQIVTARYQF